MESQRSNPQWSSPRFHLGPPFLLVFLIPSTLRYIPPPKAVKDSWSPELCYILILNLLVPCPLGVGKKPLEERNTDLSSTMPLTENGSQQLERAEEMRKPGRGWGKGKDKRMPYNQSSAPPANSRGVLGRDGWNNMDNRFWGLGRESKRVTT